MSAVSKPGILPWKGIDPRTGKRWHWSYNPNIAYAVGVAWGALVVGALWWLS
jgi:hypothetical protein